MAATPRLSGRDAAGAARPWAFVQRPARPQRAVPGISNRISRGREPCRSGPVSMFASNARVTIPSRNAISAGRVTRRPGRRSSAPCDSVESRATTTLRQRCRVKEVLASPDGAVVTGVRCDNDSGASETIAADLVVDASGRGGPTLALLQSIGRPLPEETTIGIDLGYATCYLPSRTTPRPIGRAS